MTMAAQNERYQKMLQEKMNLLDLQRTDVMNHVTCVMSLVDKAEESTQKFMKVSLESKRFMKRFQEANNAVETALSSLIQLSNALGSLNGDSSSESESGTESLKPPSKVSSPSRKKEKTKDNMAPSPGSPHPKPAENMLSKHPSEDTTGNRTNAKSTVSSTPEKEPSKASSRQGSPKESLDCDSSPEVKSPCPGRKIKAPAMSVNITVGSSERRVSLTPVNNSSAQETNVLETNRRSSGSNVQETKTDSTLNPSVKAFLAAAVEANVTCSAAEQHVPISQEVPGPENRISHGQPTKDNSPPKGLNKNEMCAGQQEIPISNEPMAGHQSRQDTDKVASGNQPISTKVTGSSQQSRPEESNLGVSQLKSSDNVGSGANEVGIIQQKRPNMKEIATHSPPRARTRSNTTGPLRSPARSPLHVDVQAHQSLGPGHPAQPHGQVYSQGQQPSNVPQGGIPSHYPPPSPTFSHSSVGSGAPPPPGVSHSSVGSGAFPPPGGPRSPTLRPQCGDILKVQVTHIESPSRFWIQETQPCVQQFVNDVGQFYCQANIPVPLPYPGLICCAKFSQDQCWYRAHVTYVHPVTPGMVPPDVRVDVYFTDYGNSETVSSRNIRSLHKQFYQVPPLARRCGLAQVTGTGKGGNWTTEMIAYFNSICLSSIGYAEVVQIQPNGFLSIRLSITEKVQLEEGVFRENVKNVADILVSKGLARYVPPSVPPTPTGARSPAPSEQSQMKSSPPSEKGSVASAKISDSGSVPKKESSEKKGSGVAGEKVNEDTPTTKQTKKNSKANNKVSSATAPKPEEDKVADRPKESPEKKPKEKMEIKMRQDLPIVEGRLLMALSYIVNPNEFYVHLITPEAALIDDLFNKLQEHYDNKENHVGLDVVKGLNIGDFCCAKFDKQPGWYRGRIQELRSVGPKDRRKWDFKVFYVDYGNTEWVLETDVQPLDRSFSEPPAQVVKCSLAHITPKLLAEQKHVKKNNKALRWSDQAIKTFTRLTGYEAKLYGYVTSVPADISKPIEVNLSISTSQIEIYLNQELVNLDLASSDILKKEMADDDDLEVSSTKWLESNSDPGIGDSDTGLPNSPNSLMDVLEKLDPMAIHFNAEMNSYGFDRDDPEMATMGYKSENNICFYHVSGRGCHRGDSCQYEHPDLGHQDSCGEGNCDHPPDVPTRKRRHRKLPKCIKYHAVHQWLGLPCPSKMKQDNIRETTLCYCTNNLVELLPEESIVCVLVTAIHSPVHFWVQFVFGPRPLDQLKIDCSKSLERPWEDGETLESLNENINTTCNKNPSKMHDLTIPALGEIVLARYSKDKKWYRARVTCVEEEKIEVFHVDYGTSHWVTKKDVQPALPQFLHLPFQAVQCRLDGLEENQACTELSDKARKYFEQVATGAPMVAYIIERDMDNLLYIELYNTAGDEDICINKKLVEIGFYQPPPGSEKEGKVS